MITNWCIICLNQGKYLHSIFDYNGNLTHADMIASIAGIKMVTLEIKNDLICMNCQRKLRELYEFKDLIKRSYLKMNALNHRRLQFDNIDEIKCTLKPIQEQRRQKSPDYIELIAEKENVITYNGTVITKICNEQPMTTAGTGDDDDITDFPDMEYTGSYSDEETQHSTCKADINQTTESKHVTVCIKPIYIKDIIVKRPKITRKKLSSIKGRLKPAIVCTYCGKLCKSIDNHMLTHTGDRRFKCNQGKCKKTFLTVAQLNLHIKKHLSDVKYKCDHCTAVFTEKGSLISHLTTHTDNRPHVCDICNKSFKRSHILVRHKLIHTIPMVKCELCPITCRTKHALAHHMRVHTRERPFACEICSQPYSYKHDFNRHCLKKHGVFLNHRSINVMNEETVQRERVIIKDLFNKINSGLNQDEIVNPFEGPGAGMAFEMAIKYLKENKIPIFDSF